MKLRTLWIGLASLVLAFSLSVSAMASETGTGTVEKQVRHELNMLPYVNAFDYMAFRVDDNGTVTLSGDVTNPVLKSEAGNVIQRVAGVERVENQIRVLPLSFIDNGLRLRLYRTIYGYPGLEKYSLGVIQPIRIIVENGHVTLMGVVDSEADRNIAGIRASSVPGIFSVANELRVARS